MADIVSVEEYKLYLKRVYGDRKLGKDNEFDFYYSNILLPGLTKTLEYYFDNDFQSTTRTETFSIEEDTKRLYPKYRPISSITSVTVSDTALTSSDYKLLALDNSIILSSQLNISGQIIESTYWPYGYNHIVIVYVGGYTLARGDKYALCKLIAKVDESDTRQFSNIDAAMSSFASELKSDTVLYDMFNMQFKRYTV